LAKILDQANDSLSSILKKMEKTLATPREKTKENAPSYKIISVSKNMIGIIIGANGKVIQNIQKNSGAIVNITEKKKFGCVKIFGANEKIVKDAENEILNLINQPILNEIYDGIVMSVLNYGAFVEFLPGKVGLLRTNDVDIVKIDYLPSVLKIGDKINVMLIEILPDNKYGLSHKVLINKDNI
jgi:polyribonucleotide nucleotidyltransferase